MQQLLVATRKGLFVLPPGRHGWDLRRPHFPGEPVGPEPSLVGPVLEPWPLEQGPPREPEELAPELPRELTPAPMLAACETLIAPAAAPRADINFAAPAPSVPTTKAV